MSAVANGAGNGWAARLGRVAPGVPALLSYRGADLPRDLVAGLSVASVALPVGVAYAALAGFKPEVGLYSSILPLVAYALFGTSRQLILGPDSATCALVAAAVAPLAAGNGDLYLSLSVTLCFLAGAICIGASFLRLGVLADFLSKPILTGFLNGIAISIALGQLGKLFGFSMESGGIVPRLLEFIDKLDLTHGPTLAVGVASFAVLLVAPRVLRRVPAALLVMALAAVAVKLLGLEAAGVQTVGAVPAGLPSLRLPHFPTGMLPRLLGDAAGLALISFSSMMLTGRSFAVKNRYDIDADREFAALGVANVASALSQGFAISGADSRTAMNDAAGGRTQVAGLVAAGAIAVVLLFLTGPLRYVPTAALGAVLMMAAYSLVDVHTLRQLYQVDRRELLLSLLATLGVVAVGAIEAILVAVILALVRFVRLVSRPRVEVLGSPEGLSGLHSVDRHPGALTVPGLLLLRFNAPLVFFNAPYFKQQALAAARAAGPQLEWLVLDMIPVTMVDVTGLYTARELIDTLKERGVTFAMAGRQTEWRQWAERRKFEAFADLPAFPTLDAAIAAYRATRGTAAGSTPAGRASH
ncbi:MAG TPA: SulP family inorganic anion transporter [Candidatus Methylomirabilis sp.]|nr:SulP family inorganic anion transporter [Candidatus Methylomirabilis sp.]